ncbi:MAG: molybdopterin-dependent oxidoreductase, partial [Caldisericia bacterium]|nr:molybdopterin-dependent oxidoreductase [Caldisericia bacterium]
LYCVEGWNVKILWEGFLVRDLLEDVGITKDAKVLIFYAIDGYSTSLPIDYFYNNDILIAYKMNGVVLPPERGFPFQLVAENKWGYKWIKWIEKIEVSSNEDYRGYWEERGFSNEGDLDKSFIENPK